MLLPQASPDLPGSHQILAYKEYARLGYISVTCFRIKTAPKDEVPVWQLVKMSTLGGDCGVPNSSQEQDVRCSR